MRPGGEVGARSSDDHAHGFWALDDEPEFRRAMCDFLADGIAKGLRVAYIGTGSDAELLADLADLDDRDRLLDIGALDVSSVTETYRPDGVADPEDMVASYARATESALAAGFEGLRVVADATNMIRSPDEVETFGRYEHLIDRYMLQHPFSAICAYRVDELPAEAVTQIAALHPTTTFACPFQMYPAEDGSIVITGEIDLAGHELFERTLRRIVWNTGDGPTVFDMSRVAFIDHNSLLMLVEHGSQNGRSIAFRSPRTIVTRILQLLDVAEVEVESSP